MTTFPIRLLILFVLLVLGCHSPGNRVGGLYSTDTLPLIPKSDTNENEQKNRLIAFVGEKIDVKALPYESGSMDAGFAAKYKVLLRVYGNYSKDTIEFKAYDHYGWPPFSEYKNVLLFVSEYEGKYYHQKYQYFDVYKTKNGRWASSYKPHDYEYSHSKTAAVKPEIIEFAEKVAYPLKIKEADGTIFTVSYPEPWYKITGDSAIAVYGNYLEDLFALKRHGVLKSRGLFETTLEEEELMIQDVELEEIGGSTTNESPVEEKPMEDKEKKFKAFWKSFAASVTKPGLQQFRRIALDNLWICDTTLKANTFINKCFTEVFDDALLKSLADSSKIRYTMAEAGFPHLLSGARKVIIKEGKRYVFRQVVVTKTEDAKTPSMVLFDFIETKKGYRFYGAGYYGGKKCCE